MNNDYNNELSVIDQQTATVQQARVVSVSGNHVLVDLQQGTIEEARVAFSCLVQPLPDDLVLCSKTVSGDFFILSILERSSLQTMTLAFPADAGIHTNGELTVASSKSLNLVAAGNLNCISDQAVHKSNNAVIDYEECTAKGSVFQAHFKTIKTISQLTTTIIGQCIHKMKNYFRHTENYDQIKSGQMCRKTEGLYSMDSAYTVMVSKKDTKIDGERIHMG
jgi:hypothetical protein